MNEALGEGTVSHSTVARRFASGDTSLEDDERSGRPVELEDREVLRVLQECPDATTRELAQSLGFAHTTIQNRLHSLGYLLSLPLPTGIWRSWDGSQFAIHRIPQT